MGVWVVGGCGGVWGFVVVLFLLLVAASFFFFVGFAAALRWVWSGLVVGRMYLCINGLCGSMLWVCASLSEDKKILHGLGLLVWKLAASGVVVCDWKPVKKLG